MGEADQINTPHEPSDLHSLLIRSQLGATLVALAVITLGWMIVAPNLPASALRERLDVTWAQANEFGLVQDWSVFSPNPRNSSLDVRARVEHRDGTIEFWDIADFDPAIGAYREYRWNKWQERVRLDARSDLWAPTASWIAERHRRDGVLPAQIVLIRRWIEHSPLQDGEPLIDEGWNEFEFFTWEPNE